jgi:hypothetical protein
VDPDLQQIGTWFDDILDDWEWPSPPHDELEFDNDNMRGDVEQRLPDGINTPAWGILPLFAENRVEGPRAPITPEQSREGVPVRQDTEQGETDAAMVESQSRQAREIREEDRLPARPMNDELGGPRVVVMQPAVKQGLTGGRSAGTTLERWMEQPEVNEPWWYGLRQGSLSFPGRALGSEANKLSSARLRRCASADL